MRHCKTLLATITALAIGSANAGEWTNLNDDELVQEIPLRPHHLDTIIARLLRPTRRLGNAL